VKYNGAQYSLTRATFSSLELNDLYAMRTFFFVPQANLKPSMVKYSFSSALESVAVIVRLVCPTEHQGWSAYLWSIRNRFIITLSNFIGTYTHFPHVNDVVSVLGAHHKLCPP